MNTKKVLTYGIAALALCACSNNDIVENLPGVADGRQTIVLKVADAQSRAGRPLLSSQAGQSIENVVIFVTDDVNKVVWKKHLDAWNSADNTLPLQSTATENGREASVEIPKDEFRMLGGNTYHIYSYGYSNASDYDLSAITQLKEGDTFTGDAKVTLKAGAVGEEIFGGDCSVEGNMGGVRAEVVLQRQVAGAFAYLTKIPYVTDTQGHVGRYLMLTASNPQSSLVLGCFDNAGKCPYVVNASGASTETAVYTIDIMDWFGELKAELDEDGRSTGLIAVADNWKGDAACYKAGSVFAGNFLVPFAKTEAATFQLKLCYDNDPSTAMRTWYVTLPESAPQLDEYSVTRYADGAWQTAATTDTYTVYNVLRNHLYGIGVKDSDTLPGGNTPGGDDPDPDQPGDEPEPINNKQELTVEVSHNWSAIYNMSVE